MFEDLSANKWFCRDISYSVMKKYLIFVRFVCLVLDLFPFLSNCMALVLSCSMMLVFPSFLNLDFSAAHSPCLLHCIFRLVSQPLVLQWLIALYFNSNAKFIFTHDSLETLSMLIIGWILKRVFYLDYIAHILNNYSDQIFNSYFRCKSKLKNNIIWTLKSYCMNMQRIKK